MVELKLAEKPNRKPADELADIRERIKALKERETQLRELAIAGGCDLMGDEFKIVVQRTKSERVDTATMKRELGLAFLRPFLNAIETVVVKTKKV